MTTVCEHWADEGLCKNCLEKLLGDIENKNRENWQKDVKNEAELVALRQRLLDLTRDRDFHRDESSESRADLKRMSDAFKAAEEEKRHKFMIEIMQRAWRERHGIKA